MDEDLLSSPDPLNDSLTFHSSAKTRRTSKAQTSLQPKSGSPNKQTFELDVGDRISPQKIRVTVEAGSDKENGYRHLVESTSPTRSRANRCREKTTTTKVPVKGLSDWEDDVREVTTPKRGRGRPRKSTGTPVPVNRGGCTSTATRRRRKSIGDLVGGDDEDDYDFQIGKDVQVGRGKRRSRSRSTNAASQKSTLVMEQAEDGARSSTAAKKGKGRRKSLLPEEVNLLEDENSRKAPEPVDPEPMHNGIFEEVDGNSASVPSTYSTIRSTTAIGVYDPDIVIARFDPGNETPRRTGWSSPRPVEDVHTLSPAFNGYISPSVSPHKNASEVRKSVTTSAGSPEQTYRPGGDFVNEEEEGLGEMPEFDTMLESEGFSMISADSVPSLREHLSSPANQDEEPSNVAKIQNLGSAQRLPPAQQKGSVSEAPKELLEAARASQRFQDHSFLSVQNSRMDDTFSSIPPEILDAATPGRKTYTSKLQSQRNSRVEDSFSSIAPEILEAATPGRDLPKAKAIKPNNSQIYEDSFSAIPSAVLDAATPAHARHASANPRTTLVTAPSEKLIIPSFTRPSSSGRNSANPASKRLPTPDETPSPPADSAHQTSESSNLPLPGVEPVRQPSVMDSSIHSQMRSSPPSVAPRRYTYTAHLRQRRELQPDVTQTPSIVFSSPALPPPIHIARAQSGLAVQTEETPRPGLSPIARAGRALQDAVGPVSSPRGRAQSLGSPFKSPIAERISSSIVPPNQSPSSNQQEKQNLGSSFPNLWTRSPYQDDPFRNNVPSQQQSIAAVAEKHPYTLELPEQRRLADSRLSVIRTEGNSVLSDDAMSWQAEEEITADDATASLVHNISSPTRERSSSIQASQQIPISLAQTLEQKWAAERDAVRKQIQNANSSQVILIDSDDEARADDDGLDEDDEDFGLLLETLNSSSPVAQRPEVLLPKDNVEKPRRSKIPSPWRKNSKRLVYSDELSHLSSPVVPAILPRGKDLINKGTRDFDNDFLDLSSIVIPQKADFRPQVRESGNLDLSALLASSSPNKSRPPVLVRTLQPTAQLQRKPSFSSLSSLRTEEESRRRRQQPYVPIPQKEGFQPRVRESSDGGNADASSLFDSSALKSSAYVNNIFGVHTKGDTVFQNQTPELSSSSAAEPLGLSSPSRTNSLRMSVQRPPAQVFEADRSDDSTTFSPTFEEEKEIRSIDNRTLKWTENVRLASTHMQPFVSPTKSCLRSPLKTPSHGCGSGGNGADISPSKNVAFVSSSPVPSSCVAEPLSSTTWSKDHWVLLQAIWYSWRPENNSGSEDGPRGRRRNSTRVISRLLGKKVFSGEDEMRLKQWHLEIVDEFRGEVPGWEEKVIAMRLFSLIIGEKQRNADLVAN